jgi:hypothetical protein
MVPIIIEYLSVRPERGSKGSERVFTVCRSK